LLRVALKLKRSQVFVKRKWMAGIYTRRFQSKTSSNIINISVLKNK
jgi:hypothetical protein